MQPAPRGVTKEVVGEIVRQTPPSVLKVGVFVRQTMAEINQMLEECQLDRAQLHGGHTWEQTQALVRPSWRVMGIASATAAQQALAAPDALLHLDAPVIPNQATNTTPGGGTGMAANWDLAAQVAEEKAVVLAGGLNQHNVLHAITQVQPFGIDVSSGIEESPGVKHPQHMQQLFQALA